MNTELAIGTVLFERYEITRVMGIDATSITYEAKHIALGYTCAIKELFISGTCVRKEDGAVLFQDQQPDQIAQQKAQFMEGAKQAGVSQAPIRDTFDANGTTYIVIDYVQGEATAPKPQPQLKQKGSKKWLIFVAAALAVVAIVIYIMGLPPHFTAKLVHFGPFEGGWALELNKSGEFEVTTNPDWISIEDVLDDEIVISAGDNFSMEPRSGVVGIMSKGWFGKRYYEIPVEQQGNFASHLYVSLNEVNLPYNGSGIADTIYTDGLWTIKSKPSWVNIEEAYDEDDELYEPLKNVIVIGANTNRKGRRSGTIVLEAADKTFNITVNQGGEIGSYLSVTPDYTTFNANGDPKTFHVNCDGKWEIAVGTYSWGHLTENHNNNTITLRLDYNAGSTREDYFVVKTGSKRARVDYKQY